jgi:hypothetical protein
MDKYNFIIILLGTMYTAFITYFISSFFIMLRSLQCEFKPIHYPDIVPLEILTCFAVFTLLPFGGCFAETNGAALWKEYTCLLIYDTSE